MPTAALRGNFYFFYKSSSMFVSATFILSKRGNLKMYFKCCLILCFLYSCMKNITNERSKAIQIRFYTKCIRLSVCHSLASLGVPLTRPENFPVSLPLSFCREIAPTTAPPADHNPRELVEGTVLLEIALAGRLPCFSPQAPRQSGNLPEELLCFQPQPGSTAHGRTGSGEGVRSQTLFTP